MLDFVELVRRLRHRSSTIARDPRDPERRSIEPWPDPDFGGITVPHCDGRVLHAPGECRFCDASPSWQAARKAWGIAFSGHPPKEGELPCPADLAVAMRERGDYNAWPGNRPG